MGETGCRGTPNGLILKQLPAVGADGAPTQGVGGELSPPSSQQSVVIFEESSWMRRALHDLHRMCPSRG